ncbi:MAG: sodium:solute symporter family protein [Bryobacterales bacterium]
MTQLLIMGAYLLLLLGLGLITNRLFRGTARDYFLASHSIGPVLLLMSIFGTTMTAFALVGSTGEAYKAGIGVYGMLASWSGFVHTAVFFFVGIKLWAIGRRYGYMTQIQYFRDRFESDNIGLALFPFLIGLTIPYLLTGLLGAQAVTMALTRGAFPEAFSATNGGVPPWLSGLVICGIVLTYVFFGGLRGAAWANTFQTAVFMITGVFAFYLIAEKLGGASAATQAVLAAHPERLVRGDAVPQGLFFFYCLIPLSVGTFPHVFQHWLTARSAESFKLTVVAHPLFILIVWLPCILIGVWATSATMPDGSLVVPVDHAPNTELAIMVGKLTTPFVGGVLGAGILAAIMSSLDSQFLCLGSIFANDVVAHYWGRDAIDDARRLMLGRVFVVAVVAVTYLFSLAEPRAVFPLAVWAFSGFTALFPLVAAALYWRRTSTAGAYACIAVSAVVWIALFRESDYGANGAYTWQGLMPVVPMFVASTLALVAVSLVTPAPSDATVKKFFPRG